MYGWAASRRSHFPVHAASPWRCVPRAFALAMPKARGLTTAHLQMLPYLLRFINLFPSLLHLRLTGFDFVSVIDAEPAAILDESDPTLSSLLGTLKERKVLSVVLSDGDGTELRYKREDAEVDFEGSVWHVEC